MTKTMTKKVLTISFAAIFAVAIVGSTPIADAITDLVKTRVLATDDKIRVIDFKLSDKVPREGEFGGYAILTDSGQALAVTSHDGFFDSETQGLPSVDPTLPISLSAAVCGEDDSGCGSEWHTHVVKVASPTKTVNEEEVPICSIGAVGELSFQEPSEKLRILGKHLVIRGVDIGPQIYLGSLSSTGVEFDVGNPLDADPSTPEFDALAFDLNPTSDDDENLVVCIGPLATED